MWCTRTYIIFHRWAPEPASPWLLYKSKPVNGWPWRNAKENRSSENSTCSAIYEDGEMHVARSWWVSGVGVGGCRRVSVGEEGCVGRTPRVLHAYTRFIYIYKFINEKRLSYESDATWRRCTRNGWGGCTVIVVASGKAVGLTSSFALLFSHTRQRTTVTALYSTTQIQF